MDYRVERINVREYIQKIMKIKSLKYNSGESGFTQ